MIFTSSDFSAEREESKFIRGGEDFCQRRIRPTTAIATTATKKILEEGQTNNLQKQHLLATIQQRAGAATLHLCCQTTHAQAALFVRRRKTLENTQ